MRDLISRAWLLLGAFLVSSLALAQDAPDPSGRVGRLAFVQGEVTLRQAGAAEAVAGVLNWPVAGNTVLSTRRGALAEVRIGSTILRLDGDSELEFTELTDDATRLRLRYGSAIVQVGAENAAGLELRTAQAAVRADGAARFRVDADGRRDLTAVSAQFGQVHAAAGGASVAVKAGSRAELGVDGVKTMLASGDNFDIWSQQRDREYVVAAGNAARYVSPETTGAEDLDRYGDWRETEEYGPVWYPRGVASDWAPYRDGRWTWLEPWGWTWVDDAPWGYAPAHYGRWVVIGKRWCWAPGRVVARPMWAPALVGWVGGGGWSVSVGAGPSVGWFPLAPGEAYIPAYRVSTRYVELVNRSHYWSAGRGTRIVYEAPVQYRYVERGITVVQQTTFGTRVVPIRPEVRVVVPRDQLRSLPVMGSGRVIETIQPRPVIVERERPRTVVVEERPRTVVVEERPRYDQRPEPRVESRSEPQRYDQRNDQRNDQRYDRRGDGRADGVGPQRPQPSPSLPAVAPAPVQAPAAAPATVTAAPQPARSVMQAPLPSAPQMEGPRRERSESPRPSYTPPQQSQPAAAPSQPQQAAPQRERAPERTPEPGRPPGPRDGRKNGERDTN